MNQNETPEDIIAEYRADVTLMFAKDHPPPTPDYVAILLNRIEEAVGRRIVAEARIRHRHGNSAALREALLKIEKLNHYDLGCVRSEKSRRAMDAKILDIELTIRAALAAPARNADRFATVGAAHKAWRATKQERDFADWLFAPAEGGKE